MNCQGWAEIALTLGLAVVLGWPIGIYMSRVWNGERTWLDPVLQARREAVLRRLRRRPEHAARAGSAMPGALLAFNAGGLRPAVCHAASAGRPAAEPAGFRGRCRRIWPSTPPSASSPTPTGSPMAARRRMSTLSQMAGLTVQNFLSAATGAAIAAALARAFVANRGEGVGNFWADMTRTTLWVLLPLSLVLAVVLVGAGRAPDPGRLGRRRRRLEGGSADPVAVRRPPASWRSSSWASTAAASSTSTRRIRSRTRRP